MVALPAQKSDHPASSAPAKPPGPLLRNSASAANFSSTIDTPSRRIPVTTDPGLQNVSAARQSQAPNQNAIAPENASANIPANDPINTEPPDADVAGDSKQSPEPPSTGQKKDSTPASPDPTSAPAVSRAASPDSGFASPAPASPNSVEPAVTAPAKADPAPELPKTQQMLDSAPAAPSPSTHAHFSATPAADLQMHVGIRTTAFGTVEIHTTVVQNQVGVTVHGEHGLAHWFSSEVPNLESGLKDHSMNLAALHFDNGRSGVQTATSFHHGSPQRNFSQTIAAPAIFEDSQVAPESSAVDSLPLDLSISAAGRRVSILV